MNARNPHNLPPAPPIPSRPSQAEETQEFGRGSNFISLALYQIALRVGWIFKTESVIMPAFLDIIGGSGWLRGCLPMLNRFGQSIPPLLLSQRITNLPNKKYALAATTFCMGASFMALSLIWYQTQGDFYALPFVFLIIYTFFFLMTGVSQLLLNTLIGKLVGTSVRGRLAAAGSTVGGLIAIFCAWYFLRTWMSADTGKFEYVFGFTGIAFFIASLTALVLVEDKDTESETVKNSMHMIKSSLKLVVHDANFRRLMIVAGMFGMCVVLTPHYQTLARERLEVSFRSLIPWVIAQHIGVSLITLPMGWLADRFGNRIVLQILMFLLSVTPVLGLVLSWSGDFGRMMYPFVFFLLGLTPIVARFLTNYTLEVTDRAKHPLYLSTLGLFISIPVFATSLIFGALVDIVGFEAVFLTVVVFLLIGLAVSFRLDEPRKQASNGSHA
ncbi:MFS transporter [Mariniblastus fucicola]|uniref:Major Facilitator Superfamily protein n=1 Tax=Mariniblastus fucicola TaxID=980251 RepID=A0A5B9PD54_9BACT|nr:MFS transporter [Mariniblastus fucicola]QEG24308.1 Major Facilitator Superfamily protein [Mariniblastus fucicola]